MTGITTAPSNCELGIEASRGELACERPCRDGDRTGRIAANPLERLVRIMHANERLMDELALIRRRIVRARDYLNSPEGNARFGAENLAYCKNKHRGLLAQLRANRIEVYRILGLDAAEGKTAS